MLAANLVNVFVRRTPPLLRHNEGDVLRPFDFPAPVFQFLIGVSLALFLEKRHAHGRTPPEARLDAVRRFALLIVLGIVLDDVGALETRLHWGVLQTLGLGGIVATLLSGLSDAIVGAVTLFMLGVFSGVGYGEVHGSAGAALAFVPLTLCGLLVGGALVRPRPLEGCTRRSALVGAVAGSAAAGLYALGIPFNKLLGTSSFVALATAVAAGLVGGAAALEAAGHDFPEPLVEVGRNALTAWVLQYVLVFYPAWLLFPSWRRLALGLGLVAVAAVTTAVAALAVGLGRRGVRIPI